MRTLEIVCNEIFDYAGTFPPANLVFEEALRTTACFPRELSRPYLVAADLVTQAVNLAKIDSTCLSRFGVEAGRKFRIAALISEFGSNSSKLVGELLAVKAFNASSSSGSISVEVISLEGKLSAEAQARPASLRDLFHRVQDTLADISVNVFVEINAASSNVHEEIALLSEALGAANGSGRSLKFGIKFRGAGPTAVNNRLLGEILPVLVDSGLPLKATAGLHHPIIEKKRYGESNNLGFLNLLCAILLRQVLREKFSVELLLECLGADSLAPFHFGDDKLTFKDLSVDALQLQSAKNAVSFSIGSCSINEPDDDLVRLFGEPS